MGLASRMPAPGGSCFFHRKKVRPPALLPHAGEGARRADEGARAQRRAAFDLIRRRGRAGAARFARALIRRFAPPSPASREKGCLVGPHPELCATFSRFARSEEHQSELMSLMSISSAVFCLKKKNINTLQQHDYRQIFKPTLPS